MTDISAGFRPPCWYPSRWAPAWRLHTNLYKFGENVSPHIYHKKNCCDLNLGESFCISTFFLFPDSRLNLLNGFYFFILIYFEWRDTENQQLGPKFYSLGVELICWNLCVFWDWRGREAFLSSYQVSKKRYTLKKWLFRNMYNFEQFQCFHCRLHLKASVSFSTKSLYAARRLPCTPPPSQKSDWLLLSYHADIVPSRTAFCQ